MSLRIPYFTIQAPVPGNQKYWARIQMTNNILVKQEVHGWQTNHEHLDFDKISVIGWTNPHKGWTELARFTMNEDYQPPLAGKNTISVFTPRMRKIEPKDYTGIAA